MLQYVYALLRIIQTLFHFAFFNQTNGESVPLKGSAIGSGSNGRIPLISPNPIQNVLKSSVAPSQQSQMHITGEASMNDNLGGITFDSHIENHWSVDVLNHTNTLNDESSQVEQQTISKNKKSMQLNRSEQFYMQKKCPQPVENEAVCEASESTGMQSVASTSHEKLSPKIHTYHTRAKSVKKVLNNGFGKVCFKRFMRYYSNDHLLYFIPPFLCYSIFFRIYQV